MMNGLNQYDYHARLYDPAVIRFNTVDSLQEKYPNISLYAYVGNNPINAINPNGKLIIFINACILEKVQKTL
ncbi:MAG: RHS repeat-associated core domain-containing protein [Dysgonomonas sp.]